MGRQVGLFDLSRQAVPSWAVREMWVGEPELIEFIAAGTVLCDICGRPVGFDDLDRFPVEDEHQGVFFCMQCAALRFGLDESRCYGCGKRLYIDVPWIFSSLGDEDVPSFLRPRIVLRVEALQDPCRKGHSVSYFFCYDCARSGNVHIDNTERCSDCGRLFDVREDVGCHNADGRFVCHRCWTSYVLEVGMTEKDIEAGHILNGGWAPCSQLAACGYRYVGVLGYDAAWDDSWKELARRIVRRLEGMHWVLRRVWIGVAPDLELWVRSDDPAIQQMLDIAAVLAS